MTNPFTPARIAELRALAEKATAGPWRQHLVDDTVVIDATGEVIAETFPDGGVDEDIDFATDTEQREANAAFIAAADPPTLTAALDEIERLREALAEATADRFQEGRRVGDAIAAAIAALRGTDDAQGCLRVADADGVTYKEGEA